MNKIYVSSEHIKYDFSGYLSELIAKCAGDTEIVLENGEYFIEKPVLLQGKKGLIFDGGGSILVPRFYADRYYGESTDCFHTEDCEKIAFKNFKVCASSPANTAGKILDVTSEYVEVELNSSVPLSGRELCLGGMTYTQNKLSDFVPQHHWGKSNHTDIERHVTIAGAFRSSAPEKLDCDREVLKDNHWKIFTCQNNELLSPGMKCSIYHAYYGLSAFVFKGTKNVIIENVHISNFGGMGFVILPRCADFVFRNVVLASEDMEHQPYSTCSDGIHTTGVGGHFELDGCRFELLGDDCLNLHTNALTVEAVSQSHMKLFLDKPYSIFPEDWAQKGDVLRIYDGKTLEFKGEATAGNVSEGEIDLEKAQCEIFPGDFVTNSFYFPELVVKNCVVRNTRGRIVVQSADSCKIFGNSFESTKICLYLSTAFRFWGEAGPVKNAEIYNNRFVLSGRDTVFVRVNDENADKVFHMHKNISIHDNVFENVKGNAIKVMCTDNVTVKDNRFINCSENPVSLINCTEINKGM